MTDLSSGEATPGSQEDTPPVPPRYGFGAFVRHAWEVFRRDPQRAIGIFCLLHVLAALIPFVFFFEVSDEATLPLIFLTRVVIPVIVGSIAVAIASRILGRETAPDGSPHEDAPLEDVEPADASGTRALDLFALSLIAAMFSIAGVLFLRAYGFLILHMFYGPPIAMQVAVLEGRSFSEATRRARTLLRGNWRLILYMLNVALLIGILNLILLGPVYGLLPDDFDMAASLAVSVVHGVVLGVLTSYLAAVQVALYEHLRDQPARGDLPASGAGVEPPAGVDRTETPS